ncbi:hypothetical protein GCM10009690_07820 [Brevibacterium permense]|uniref:Uncharacterized protein n=1 Tax=Brevibacterium permense TaxID=234834 RepID=A0ABN1ZYL5_9MICO
MPAHSECAVDDDRGEPGLPGGFDPDADEFDHARQEHRYVLSCHSWVLHTGVVGGALLEPEP